MNDIKINWKSFLTFLALFLAAALFFNLAMSFILLSTNNLNNPRAIMLANTIAHLFTFTGVGIAFPLLNKYKIYEFYQNRPYKDLLFLILTFFIVLLIQPSLSLLTEITNLIKLPSNIDNFLSQYENMANELLKQTMNDSGIGFLLLNIVYVALVPAVGEELIFRGIIQKYLIKLTKHAWIGIILTGLIFSLFHLSWSTILAIWFFGIILGIVYYTTGNIWYSMFMHFINNLMATLSYWLASNNKISYSLEEIDNIKFQLWIELISLILMILFIIFLFKFIKLKRENTKDI
ncbi:MAG TPA: CPBP family intramembrane metalloprotease [Bacteroidales bacterium]|nr:CPBP family intramembrane metalloprotease [Bacteroidales bacterium]